MNACLNGMADHGRYWEFQPELQEDAYDLRKRIEAIRAEIARLTTP